METVADLAKRILEAGGRVDVRDAKMSSAAMRAATNLVELAWAKAASRRGIAVLLAAELEKERLGRMLKTRASPAGP
jgi:hypothetical protein